MAITIKSAREIELMRESCRLLSEVHDRLKEAIKPGISTYEINALGERLIRGYGCEPNFAFRISRIITDFRLPSVYL